MKVCKECGKENADSSRYCESCGKELSAGAGALAEEATAVEKDTSQVQETAAEPQQGLIACPECKAWNEPDYVYCQRCGKPLREAGRRPTPPPAPKTVQEDITQCPACKARVRVGDKFCSNCGNVMTEMPRRAEDSGKTQVISVRPGPRAHLVVLLEGGKEGDRHPLSADSTQIGRREGDIRLEESSVSRAHARVVREGDVYYLEDTGSTNGTFLRIQDRTKLTHGDEIQVGLVRLRFEATSQAT